MATADRASGRAVTVTAAMVAPASVVAATAMGAATVMAMAAVMVAVMDMGAAAASDRFPCQADPSKPARSAGAGFSVPCWALSSPQEEEPDQDQDGDRHP